MSARCFLSILKGPDYPKLASVALLLLIGALSAAEAAETRHCSSPEGRKTERDLFIVAHPDDDLLFMNPDIATCIQSGDEVKTVYLTSGDAGKQVPFWRYRERGILAAYARMAGVANAWTATDRSFGNKLIRVYTLNAEPKISTVFLRLPDGDRKGRGFPTTGFQSLLRLWEGQISRVASLDGKNTYTKAELIQTLTHLMMDLQVHHIHTQDASNLYGQGHADHRYGAQFAFEAHQIYAASGARHTFASYRGYNIANEPPNLPRNIYDEMHAVFLTYAEGCGSMRADCLIGNFYRWGSRQYSIASLQNLSGQIRLISGRCLTAGPKRFDGSAPVTVSRCGEPGGAHASSQTWSLKEDGSIAALDGRCLEVFDGLPKGGTSIRLGACTGRPRQRWTAFENGQIRGFTSKCLDAGGSSANDTPVLLYDCGPVPGQRWVLPPGSSEAAVSADSR